MRRIEKRISRPPMPSRQGCIALLATVASLLTMPATAGPPYAADDPEPTDDGHYEVYFYDAGERTHSGYTSAAGIDFNYGAAADLQLTAVVPVAFEPVNGRTRGALGNVELAGKLRFLHQEATGADAAVFPRVILPSASNRVGARHPALLVPLWFQKDGGRWSTFGGGGYAINRGEGSRDFWQFAWALTRQIGPQLQLGAELAHQSADTISGRAATQIGIGLRYDLNPAFHLLAHTAPGIQPRSEADRFQGYVALLLTI